MAKKSRLDSISVPKPCAEDWNKMHGGEMSRFCGICEKNVYNISAMNTRKANKLLFETSEKVCIRMEKDAHGKVKTFKNQLHQITRRAPIAAGVLSATLAFSAATFAQSEPVKINSDKVNIVQIAKDIASETTIFGVITDQQGAVVPGTEIIFIDSKKNLTEIVVANDEGFYILGNVKSSTYEIEVRPTYGFKELHHKGIVIDGKSNLSINIILESGEPTTIGIFAEESEIKLSPAKVETKLNLLQIAELLSAKLPPVTGLFPNATSKSPDKTSRISLIISDVTGSVISGAEAILINQKIKQQFSVVSNENGIANFSYLPSGKYELRISAVGFKVKTISLNLKKGVELKETIKLDVGDLMGEVVIIKN